ncbi:ankyrin [Polyplosphaeria fusca]|uniref:Ankyrin n=1 Tax=Polyplosphaeria fusca TaxID=682080 RepID=A0A9P4R0L1_9PLEO|nr:ankyrin [Polyplosphaeria fusca]
MPTITLDEDAIDEILYLARVNDTAELDKYLSELSTQTKHAKADLVAAAVDPYSNNTALHYAAANGHSDVIKVALSYNADDDKAPTPALINALNGAGNTPLHWAAVNGHLQCVKMLIQSGADVTIINAAGHDAVFEAEINDKQDVVDWLLGAVEALEQGVGREGEAMQDNAAESSSNDPGAASAASAASANGVESVTRQMEGMNTNASSQGG